jgi:glycerol-3-phosphate dehydrogenase
MVGIDKFKITPRRGEYYLYDKKMELNLQKTIFPVPTEVSKGIVVTPTDERNVLIGPNAEEIDNVENKSTTRKGLDKVMEGANKTVPGLSKKGIIREFVGLRPAIKETGDFLIEASDEVSGFINAAGIQSPGLASSPAIAEMVVGIVKEELGDLNEKSDFDPNYQGPPKFRHMTHAEQAKLVEENPDYGQIICRCETVTKGEILDIIREPVGARTVNAVKRRARPGAGRCQGGFCEPKVVSILAEELGIEENEVCLESAKSKLLKEKTKAPLLKEVAK